MKRQEFRMQVVLALIPSISDNLEKMTLEEIRTIFPEKVPNSVKPSEWLAVYNQVFAILLDQRADKIVEMSYYPE